MRFVRLALLLVFLIATACGDPEAVSTAASESEASAPASEPTEMTAEESEEMGGESEGSTVAVADSDLGAILTDGDGNTLYLLTGDNQGDSTCYDDCAANWPPLNAPATAGDGADDALLGATERDDGSMQATYNDWPLYYFAGDEQAGDVNGQGVGGVWFVLDDAGEPVKEGEGDDAARDY
jgi:predicted lipoprotein with Yx(FWY)xxD motif